MSGFERRIALSAIKQLTVPDLGGASEVSVIEVLVKKGDQIDTDTQVITLESDKATLEVPATESGVIKSVEVKVGDQVSTGDVILTYESAGQAAQEQPKKETKKNGQADEKAQSATQEKKEKPSSSTSSQSEQRVLTGVLQSTSDIHAGPGVRRLAREFGVDLTQVSGSGPKQRILKEDVQSFVKMRLSQNTNLPATQTTLPSIDFSKFGPTETQALSRIKKISGKVLQRNWMLIPHVTQFGEADITTLEEFRQAQKAEFEKQKIKLTPLVFVMKAVVASLKAFPEFNASLDPSGEQLIMKKYFHLGIAVDTEEGLVVPVIRDVDKKGLADLAKELAVVSEKARQKQLTPGDMQGGCFSISSLGGIYGTAFTPIINYPEVAILGVSKSYHKPVYQEGAFVPRLTLPLSLSYDHRVIDGAGGARFLMHLSTMLSDIRNLLL